MTEEQLLEHKQLLESIYFFVVAIFGMKFTENLLALATSLREIHDSRRERRKKTRKSKGIS